MLQDFKNIFVNVKKATNAKLYRFEKIPKYINDTHIIISMTMSLITLRKMLVNINELHMLHHHE